MQDPLSQRRVAGPSLLRNSVFNLAGQVLPVAAALVSIPYLVGRLSAERFAVLSFVWVVLSFLTVFDFGLSRATTKLVAEALGRGEDSRVGVLLSTTLALQLAVGVSGSAVLLLGRDTFLQALLNVHGNVGLEAQDLFFPLAIAVPLILLYNSSEASRGNQR